MAKADKLAVRDVHSAYVAGKRQRISFGDLSRTRQEFAVECDVNEIMKRYQKTGVLPRFGQVEPRYLDLTNVPDFHAAMNLMADAEAAFMRLPAAVRLRFANDPAEFVGFAEQPENLEELRKWGLAPPAKAPEEPSGDVAEATPAPPAPKAGAAAGKASAAAPAAPTQ